MRLLITGGSGFVGRHILDQIARNRTRFDIAQVVVASRHLARFAHPVRQVKWDVCDPNSPNIEFDAIIHAATPASALLNSSAPMVMFDQILRGAQNVIDLCVRQTSPPRLLFTSSGAVYGKMPGHLAAWPEDSHLAASPLDRGNAYANGKRAAEAMFALAGYEGVCRPTIARLFAFSGRHLPLNRHFALGNFVRDALRGGPIRVRGTGRAVRSYLDGDDMARWLLCALSDDACSGQIIHVGSEAPVTISELADLVAQRAFVMDGRRVEVTIGRKVSVIDGQDRYVPMTAYTRSLLGLQETRSLSDSIDEMLRVHFESNRSRS